MSRRALWLNVVDAEIAAVRVRHAARLAAEHARMAQERQAEADRAIVAAREKRVLGGRWRAAGAKP